jgi:hypothetical protein
MSKFLKLVNKVLTEDIGGDQQGPVPSSETNINTANTNQALEPTEVSDTSSALPNEQDVNGIDLVAYKALLKTLKDSAAKLAKSDQERSQVADIDIDSKNTKEELKPVKDALMSIIYKDETPADTDWSDE